MEYMDIDDDNDCDQEDDNEMEEDEEPTPEEQARAWMGLQQVGRRIVTVKLWTWRACKVCWSLLALLRYLMSKLLAVHLDGSLSGWSDFEYY